MPPVPSRRLVVSAVSVAAAVVLAACASGGKAKPTTLAPLDRALPSRVAQDDPAVIHFLNRVTFGARPQDLDAVRRDGVAAFLDRQLHPERIDDGALETRLAGFETLNLSSKQIAEQYYQPAQDARRRRQMEAQAVAKASSGTGAPAPAPKPADPPNASDQALFRRERQVLLELSDQKMLRAVYGERQLQEVLVDFWFNHFNVFAGKGADRGLLTAYERDVVRPRVFGRFRDLLGATAESPAMLFFLDNWLSVDPNGPHPEPGGGGRRAPARRPPPSVFRPAPPALRLPPARPAQPAAKAARRGLNENYARELMELHTLGVDGGYTQKDVVEVARCFTGWTIAQPRDGGDFRFDPRQHDPGQKVVLGHVIKAGGGREDGDRVLDILARDPHTAHFIATKLVRRFVADDPPPALVDRVARRFRETDGDLREVYRAILLAPEFWSAQARAAKVKTPFEFVASALRVTGARVDDPASAVQAVRTLGMPLYFCQPPTGYADRADAWVTTGALVSRMNFALALVDNRLPAVRVDLAALAGAPDLALARTQVLRQLLDNNASPVTLAVLDKASTVTQLVALALGAPEFQRR
jgi:uncharacterized protein (DUF1800 family)